MSPITLKIVNNLYALFRGDDRSDRGDTQFAWHAVIE